MSELWEIVGRVQQSDTNQADRKWKEEVEARRILQLQSQATQQGGTNIDDFLKSLTVPADDMPTLSVQTNTEARFNAPINTKPQFPPPPKAPTPKSQSNI